MKAALYTAPGGPEVLTYQEVADPIAGAGELLIKVEAISIEGGDLTHRRLVTPAHANWVVGYAAAGEVIALGEGVTSFQVGQKVTTFAPDGSHASLRAVAAATSWLVPAGMDMVTAATALIWLGTAAHALALADFKPGEKVLVTGATGGVGNGVVQLVAAAGSEVVGTASRAESLEQLKALGLTKPVVLGGSAIGQQVQAAFAGERFDVVIDTVGTPSLPDLLPYLNEGARVVIVGAKEFDTPITLTTVDLLSRRLQIIGCYIGPVMHQPAVRELLTQTLDRVASGELQVPLDQTYPLSQAVAAHQRAEERGRVGRVAIILAKE
jgi:NADPH2:quinone reductase